MEEYLKITKEDLFKAFCIWVDDVKENSEKYSNLTIIDRTTSEYSDLCSNHLFNILKEIK